MLDDGDPLESPVEPLLNPGSFTNPIPEVVELGPTDFTPTQYLNTGNPGGMEQKDSLYTDALENFTDGDGLTDAAVALGNDGTLVGLNPFFAAFNNLDPNLNGVTDMDGGQVCFEKLCLDGIDYRLGVHGYSKNSQFLIITDLWSFAKVKS